MERREWRLERKGKEMGFGQKVRRRRKQKEKERFFPAGVEKRGFGLVGKKGETGKERSFGRKRVSLELRAVRKQEGRSKRRKEFRRDLFRKDLDSVLTLKRLKVIFPSLMFMSYGVYVRLESSKPLLL